MKLHRLFNLTELAPAAGLHFVRREDAEAYKQLVRWPYAAEGRWPLADGGSVPLEAVDLRVEVVDVPVVLEPALHLAVQERDGALGTAPLLPGDCFDPDEWTPCTPAQLAHPVSGPRLEQAQRQLHQSDWGRRPGEGPA
jgi:hypothetical protein